MSAGQKICPNQLLLHSISGRNLHPHGEGRRRLHVIIDTGKILEINILPTVMRTRSEKSR